MILKCNCKSPYQDNLYGEGNRVFNLIRKEGSPTGRCSICGTEKGKSGDEEKPKGKKK